LAFIIFHAEQEKHNEIKENLAVQQGPCAEKLSHRRNSFFAVVNQFKTNVHSVSIHALLFCLFLQKTMEIAKLISDAWAVSDVFWEKERYGRTGLHKI